MISALAVLFVSFVVGHPTHTACDADTNPPPGLVIPPGYAVDGWAYADGSEIHLAPAVCAGLNAAPGTAEFARGYNVLAHEAWHAAGEPNEGCAELFARLSPYDYMTRFWAMPPAVALRAAWGVGEYTNRKPAPYHAFGKLACLPRIIEFNERSGL